MKLRLGVTAAASAALSLALLLSAPPFGALSAQPAGAACRYADGEPGEITRGHARDAVVCLINNRRATRGRGRLDAKSSLRKAAGRHSRQMKRSRCFSHECPGEKDLAGRIFDTGYLPCGCSWGVGENIAWGERELGTPRETVKSWMQSSGHRRNILDGDFQHIGVGVVWGAPPDPGATAATYTTDFGYKR